MPPCCFASRSLSCPPYLPVGDEFRMNSWRNFLENYVKAVFTGIAHLPYRPGPESLPFEGAIIHPRGIMESYVIAALLIRLPLVGSAPVQADVCGFFFG
jgi:hypothetical protein